MDYTAIRAEQNARFDCVFCQPIESGQVIIRTFALTLVIAALFPYYENHILLLPKRHMELRAEMTLEERAEYNYLCGRISQAMLEQVGGCFEMVRQRCESNSVRHYHHHFMPNSKLIPNRVERSPITLNLDDL